MPLKTDDLFMQVNDTKSVTLQAGVAYTKGMLITLQSNGKYTNGIVFNPEDGGAVPFSRQVIGILVDDVNATSADKVGIRNMECLKVHIMGFILCILICII
jgi:hypothetical protein